jgi:rare lipoprotein A
MNELATQLAKTWDPNARMRQERADVKREKHASKTTKLGVANKTLPCGTRVRVCLNRRRPCVNVRVVDRGPYVAGRSFDLTEATARRIGFLSRGVGPVYVSTG